MMLKTCLVLISFAVLGLTHHLPGSQSRIIGGEDAYDGQVPWQASLQYFNEHVCGASIISPSYLVTAAHCVSDFPDYFSVVTGLYDLTNMTSGNPVSHGIRAFHKHPEFVDVLALGRPNDLAIIEVMSPINLQGWDTASIKIAHDDGYDYVGQHCVISGWGYTEENATSWSEVLQVAKVEIMSNEDCDAADFLGGRISDGQVCVMGENNSTACDGDNGGPLFCRVNAHWSLVGVTSWGIHGCDESYPYVYTRLSNYTVWLDDIAGPL